MLLITKNHLTFKQAESLLSTRIIHQVKRNGRLTMTDLSLQYVMVESDALAIDLVVHVPPI